MKKLIVILAALILVACQSEKKDSKEVWIYTSMYKDTISDITPKLEKAFPGVTFNWYQAGSEDISAKVNAEMLAGGTQADLLISSDRFWYEEMANSGNLHAYTPKATDEIPRQLKHPEAFYNVVSIPVMVMSYNNEAVNEQDAPKSFKEMAEPKWKGKFTTGSPLASGTNFTTMAMLQNHYGWDYFKKLKDNQTIAQGGNSAVLRRIQNKERPIGWVLLENILRFQKQDDRIKIVYPQDGVVIHSNVLAITKKAESRTLAQQVADWMFGEAGQNAMTRSFMYSPRPSFAPPAGAPRLAELLKNSFPWTTDFLKTVTKNRSELKEKYSEIMFTK